MKNWFTSLNGAVTLSVLTLLTFLARVTGLDAMFVLPGEMGIREDQTLTIALFMFGVMVLFGGWIWALLAAARGGRTGMIVSLVFNLFVALFGGLFTLISFCSPSCAARPVGEIIVLAALIVGGVASVSAGLYLRSASQR